MFVGSFELDLSQLPLVTVIYSRAPSTQEFELLFDAYRDLSLKGELLGYVIDFRNFDPVTAPAADRKSAADIFKRHADVLRPVTVCEARVVTSTISRGTLTAFDWLTGTKWPCANFATVAEAQAWVKKRLERSGAYRTRTDSASMKAATVAGHPPR